MMTSTNKHDDDKMGVNTKEEVDNNKKVNNKDDNSDSSDDDFLPSDMFEEPEGFRPPPPPPTTETFVREASAVRPGEPTELAVKLVSHHSLWAHKLWNAGLSLARYIDRNKDVVRGKNVLELGAAAAVPSMISALCDASVSVATDYPDPELVNNMSSNFERLLPGLVKSGNLRSEGLQWGQPVDKITDISPSGKYDVVIMADLIFNHTEHVHMLESARDTMADDGVILVAFTHHIVKWADRDMKFLDIAREAPFNFLVEELYVEKWDPMFPEDPGSAEVRGTVECYTIRKQILTKQ